MKKIKLLAVGILLAAGVQAQQGSWYIGGMAGVGGSNNDQGGKDYKTLDWNFSPEFGTFLKDDIQLGLAVNVSGSSITDDGNDVSESMNFSPVLYGRKFWSIGDRLSTFAGLNLNLIMGTTTMHMSNEFGDTWEVVNDQLGFGANLNIGAAFALNDQFAVLAQYGLLGFSSVTNSPDAGDDYVISDWGFDLNTLGPVFNVGLYYTFIPASE